MKAFLKSFSYKRHSEDVNDCFSIFVQFMFIKKIPQTDKRT